MVSAITAMLAKKHDEAEKIISGKNIDDGFKSSRAILAANIAKDIKTIGMSLVP